MRRVRMTASGRVQGVFFRASARDEARRLGLTGWVRNTPEGDVEAEAQGDDDAVEAFVDFCRSGPGHADVAGLAVDDVAAVDGEDAFRVR